MFYRISVQDHVRVPPKMFGNDVKKSVLESAKKQYTGLIDQELGVVVTVEDVKEIGEGIIIPGDGASYYQTILNILSYKPELQEVVTGRIRDIADFGAFLTLGPLDGLIHVSQTMDDYVTFSKDKSLQGRDSKRALKIGDNCRAKVIAVSFKDITNPKIGLTMRQPGLGKTEWVTEPAQAAKKPAKEKQEKPAKGKTDGGKK
ncbi:DNA-directed RNA polymerase [Candidatus Woesearchaeota archaeon]|nr:DNA-directed RNA polymerase [Candidatus Woesearchaeota archaeon]